MYTGPSQLSNGNGAGARVRVGGGGVMSLLFPDPRFWVVLCYSTACIHRVNSFHEGRHGRFFHTRRLDEYCMGLVAFVVFQNEGPAEWANFDIES